MVPHWAPSLHRRWNTILICGLVSQALCLTLSEASVRSLQSLPAASAGEESIAVPAPESINGIAPRELVPAVPAPAPTSASYLISVQLGGTDAVASDYLFGKMSFVLGKFLQYPPSNCVVLEATNGTSCMDGAPVPSPGNTVVYPPPAGLTEEPYLSQIVRDSGSPMGLFQSFHAVPDVPYAGRRLAQAPGEGPSVDWDSTEERVAAWRHHENELPGFAARLEEGELLAAAERPSASPREGEHDWLRRQLRAEAPAPAPNGCVPSCAVTMAIIFTSGADPAKWNKTLAFFSSGRFLAKMQSAGAEVDTVQLSAYQEPGKSMVTESNGGTGAAAPATAGVPTYGMPEGPGQGYGPAGSPSTPSPLQFCLEVVGNDAQVTNDTMLGVLYNMVTTPTSNPASFYLNPTNTAIIDVRQGPDRAVPVSIGRKLMEAFEEEDWLPLDTESGRQRELLQIPSADPVLNPAGTSNNQYNISEPSVEVTFMLAYVPPLAVIQVKELVSQMISDNTLLKGFQSKGLSVYQVTLQSFTFQPGAVTKALPVAAPKPPIVAPPPTIAVRADKSHALTYIIVAAVVPVSVLAMVLGGLAYWWYKRQKRAVLMDEMQGEFNPRLKLKSDAYAQMGSSNGQYSSGNSTSVADTLKQVQPRLQSQSKLLVDMPWSDWQVEPSELTILTKPDGTMWLLGSGASGRVYKAMRNGVQTVAVKTFNDEMTRGAITSLTSPQQAAHFRREISILKSCHDRNIVQFLGACLKEGQTILVTEFLENGDLYHAINSQQGARYSWYRMQLPDGKPVPNSGMARRVALDVARGLHFLHSKKIVHFDLKSANILLARDFTAKIADVGLARILKDDVLSTRREVGTFAWAAPEVLLGHRCTEKADIYSFGVLLHELSAGESPSSRQLRRLRIPDECPEEVEDLIYRCLDPQPHLRPSARDLVAVLSCLPAVPPFAPPPRLSTDPPYHRHNRSLSFTSTLSSFSIQHPQQPPR